MGHTSRSAFGFVFTAGAAAVFLIVTGLIGYQPPGRIDLVEAWWRRGVWADGVIWEQVAIGAALLLAAGLMASRINRRLSRGR